MTINQSKLSQLYIGIDGGGSKCRATIYCFDKGVLGSGVSGRANPLHGIEHSINSIKHSVELALQEAQLAPENLKHMIAGIGLAGVIMPQLYQAINQWRHPFQAMYLTTDLHTACIGAHQGKDGAVIITGTGSCGFAKAGNKTLSIGGHGFGLGDKGSGAWLGQKAAEYALLDLDGFGDKTKLTQALLTQLNVQDAIGIVEKLAGQSSSEYAKLARTVLECAKAQDAVAQQIVVEGASYISEMARKLIALQGGRFSMIGGLAEPLQAWLDDDVVALIEPALEQPEIGAVYFAKQQHQH
ncbi:N-acetylglucosamine kinase [Shewanella maritima]|uniref:N-acetylglucosamine kinase n=1 Tax=Shewanella maritima TaxID=2520507 RepID=UPI0037367FB2